MTELDELAERYIKENTLYDTDRVVHKAYKAGFEACANLIMDSIKFMTDNNPKL